MDKLNDEVINTLLKMNINYLELKPFLYKYLNNINELATQSKQQQINAIEQIKTSKLNSAIIAKKLNISRTTLYNNAILKEYIDFVVEELNQTNPYSTNSELQEQNRELKIQISKMIDRDIDLEVEHQRVLELEEMLKEKNKEIERLMARNIELSNENHKLKQSQKSNNFKIIPINK